MVSSFLTWLKSAVPNSHTRKAEEREHSGDKKKTKNLSLFFWALCFILLVKERCDELGKSETQESENLTALLDNVMVDVVDMRLPCCNYLPTKDYKKVHLIYFTRFTVLIHAECIDEDNSVRNVTLLPSIYFLPLIQISVAVELESISAVTR